MEIFSRKIRAAFLLNDEEKFLSSSEIINATGVVQECSQPSAISYQLKSLRAHSCVLPESTPVWERGFS
ncbi:MAG: hypothetical protein DMG94_08955 [Acidobacteria bacterium]|nr:MAG: hypothetical protein DMG94_08955 [Acidobacteriota bacterium]